MRSKVLAITLITLCSCAPKPPESPETLGADAADAEKAYFIFQTNADLRAGQFMKAWVRGCSLTGNDATGETHRKFVNAYITGLQDEPGAASTKPLQKYVKQKYWKSGLGCETVQTETPQWALE